jgi:hypothetical protein
MRVDYSMIPELQAAARRERAEAIGNAVAGAFAWIVSRLRSTRAPQPQPLARSC